MTKTIQKNIALIGGLFFLAQSILAPIANAASILGDNRVLYQHAATSADPIIFNNHNPADNGLINVVEYIDYSAAITEVIDNSEPTLQEIKDYVLGEIKKAGLNIREAEALIYCESKWDPKAYNGKNSNGTNDKGLWQINSIHKDISDADKFDYKASTKWAIAKRLSDGNWSAWSCANKRATKKVAVESEIIWQ